MASDGDSNQTQTTPTASAAADAVTIERRDNVGIVHLNDGKVNALSYGLLSAGRAAFADVASSSDAIVIAGNAKTLSAGFDLTEVMQGPEQRDAIISTGGDWFYEVFTCPKPVVIACTGHAVAGGLVFLLVGDVRVGRQGPYKFGFNEVLIGVPMPQFGISLAQYRLQPQFTESVVLGDMLSAEKALAVGALDELVDGDHHAVIDQAVVRAADLAARNADAYRITKLRARARLIERFATESRLSIGE